MHCLWVNSCEWGFPFLSSSSSSSPTTTRSLPKDREPSWHRQQRRKRTKARAGLLTYLRTGLGSLPAIHQAVVLLKAHHSRPSLVEQVENRLRRLGACQSTMPRPQDAQPTANWCYFCSQYTKKADRFCGRCGKPIGSYTANQEPAPWHTQSWANTAAPWQQALTGRREAASQEDPITQGSSQRQRTWSTWRQGGQGQGWWQAAIPGPSVGVARVASSASSSCPTRSSSSACRFGSGRSCYILRAIAIGGLADLAALHQGSAATGSLPSSETTSWRKPSRMAKPSTVRSQRRRRRRRSL